AERREAIALFVERARAARASFALSADTVPHVAEIVRRLDGLPLAIELAAARVRVLSVEQIAGRLGHSFSLLSTERRGALPRHRTLRAAIDWSYDLLSGDERQLLRRLSVFAGSFTSAAAASIAGEHASEADVVDDLGRLIDKSLLVVAEPATGEAWR